VIAIVGDIAPGASASGVGARLPRAGRAAVAAGATVETVGVVAEGPEGDRALGELARERLGHAAVLRSAARFLEPADLALALRYLPDLRVVVVLGAPDGLLPTAVDGAAFAGATLLVVTDRDAAPPGLPGDAIVIQAPAIDADGTFAGFVGQLAARLDAGSSVADAWAATIAALAVEPTTDWLPERA